MGFTDYGAPLDPSPGFDPNAPDLIRRRRQADQLAAMGMNRALAGRVARLPPEPDPSSIEDQNKFFDDWAAEGRAAHVAPPPASPALGIFSNPGVRAERADERQQSELDRLALSHMPTYQQRMQGVESVPGLGAHDIGLDAGGAGAGGLAAAASTPGPNAPIPPGPGPAAPQIGLTAEQGWTRYRLPQIEKEYAGALEGLGTGRHPGFEVGPPSALASIAGREVGPAGMRTEGGGMTSGVTAFDRPGGGATYRATNDDSIFATSGGQDTPEQHRSALAGLAARAFHPQTYDPASMDVSEATHQKDLEGRQQDLALRHMEAQIAREEAQAKDPYGMGRFALEQAALNQRAQGRDQAGIERAMAADRTGLLERQDRESKAQKILAEYEQEQRTMDALEAQIPPDAPPDSPLRAHVAQGREYALNKRNAAGATIGVRFPEQ